MTRKTAKIGEIVIGLPGKYETRGDFIGARGLGSCVAVVLFDPYTKVSSLSHVALPQKLFAPKNIKNKEPYLMAGRYATTFIDEAKVKIMSQGGRILHLQAKISGGASMFTNLKTSQAGLLKLGLRNVQAIKGELQKHEIKIVSQDVLGDLSRTVWYEVDTQDMIVTNGFTGSIKLI